MIETPQLPSITATAAGDLRQYSEKAGKRIIAKSSDPRTEEGGGQAHLGIRRLSREKGAETQEPACSHQPLGSNQGDEYATCNEIKTCWDVPRMQTPCK